jgi:hypothetical protein
MSDSNFGGGKAMSQLYTAGPSGAPITPGAIVGNMPPQPWVRSVLDGRRMMFNRIPGADFPAGYLGTITDRRSDRVLDSLKARVNQRSYQRGVHLGERIDPGDMLWPEEMNPLSGIQRQATTGERYAPLNQFFQPTPVLESKMAPRGSESIVTIDQHRVSQLALLRPTYGMPSRRQQSMQG